MANLFIAFEGIDGSGKSSQARLLAERMAHAGHKVHTTREPTEGHIGALLLRILRKEIKADHRAIALLFAADRVEHIVDKHNGLVQLLQEGNTVIADRFYFSSYAYNGAHTDLQWVMDINRMSTELLRPHAHIFIDVPPEVCMQRINANRAATELFENLTSLRKVREKYMEAFHKAAGNEHIIIINGDRPMQDIADEIWERMQEISRK